MLYWTLFTCMEWIILTTIKSSVGVLSKQKTALEFFLLILDKSKYKHDFGRFYAICGTTVLYNVITSCLESLN